MVVSIGKILGAVGAVVTVVWLVGWKLGWWQVPLPKRIEDGFPDWRRD